MAVAEVEAPDLEEEIRQRAYELFLARVVSGGEGDDLSDWLAAEAEVRERRRF